jgi:hypothetical protein
MAVEAHVDAVRQMSRPRWMTQFGDSIGDCSISQVALVGAHNGATHNIAGNVAREYAADAPETLLRHNRGHKTAAAWARTQEHSIASLLTMGVRYLDIRLSPRGPDLEPWVSHTLYSIPFARVVEDVAAFYSGLTEALWEGAPHFGKARDFGALDDNREIIILDIQRFTGVPTEPEQAAKAHDNVLRLLRTLQNLLPKEEQFVHTPLRELWKTGSRVFVFYPVELAAPQLAGLRVLPRAGCVFSDWFDKNTAPALLPLLEQGLVRRQHDIVANFLVAGCPVGPQLGPLHVTQAIMTPSTADFVKMVLSPHPKTLRSLEAMARRFNARALELWCNHVIIVDETLQHDGSRPPRHLAFDGRNVLLLDFCAVGKDPKYQLDAVDLCLLINVQRFGLPGS